MAQRMAEDDARIPAEKVREATQEEHDKAIADMAHWRAIAANPPVAPVAKELATLKESREKLMAAGKKNTLRGTAKGGLRLGRGPPESLARALRETRGCQI